MSQRLATIRAMMSELHELYRGLITEEARGTFGPPEDEAIDIGYASRKLTELAETFYKEAKRVASRLDFDIARRQVLASMSLDPPSRHLVEGSLASVTCRAREVPSVPSKATDPEGFLRLCHELGIHGDDQDLMLLTLDWKYLQTMCDKRAERGQALPPSLPQSKFGTEFTVKYNPRRFATTEWLALGGEEPEEDAGK